METSFIAFGLWSSVLGLGSLGIGWVLVMKTKDQSPKTKDPPAYFFASIPL